MGLFARLTGRLNGDSKPATKSEQPAPTRRFRGVRIMTYDPDCCQAVKAVSKQRFLEKDVPMLPLDDCDAEFCQCSYKRFDDRRTDVRRAAGS